jgi:hypothetical protein
MVDAVWQMLHSDDTAFKINGREYARLRQTHSDSVSKRLTELWKDSDYRAKQTEIQSVVQRQVFERPGYKERHRQATVQGMANPAVRAKVSAGASIAMLARWEQQDYRESRVAATTGLKNPNADQTIYHWVHQDGTVEYLTRVDMAAKYNIKSFYKLFCRNPKKSVHGWRVVKHDALDNKSL